MRGARHRGKVLVRRQSPEVVDGLIEIDLAAGGPAREVVTSQGLEGVGIDRGFGERRTQAFAGFKDVGHGILRKRKGTMPTIRRRALSVRRAPQRYR